MVTVSMDDYVRLNLIKHQCLKEINQSYKQYSRPGVSHPDFLYGVSAYMKYNTQNCQIVDVYETIKVFVWVMPYVPSQVIYTVVNTHLLIIIIII